MLIYYLILLKEVIIFFKKHFHQDLSVKDRLEFLNFWYLLIITNDIFIIVGSALKQQIENKVSRKFRKIDIKSIITLD